MPIDQRRRDGIAAAVAAYDSANPEARLPRSTVPLLAAMFPIEDMCSAVCRTLLRKALTERGWLRTCGASRKPGFCPEHQAQGSWPDTYQLQLPPVRR
jgi:hypothetical protein